MKKILKKEIVNKLGELFKEYYPPDRYERDPALLRFSNKETKITIGLEYELPYELRFKISLVKLNPSISRIKEIIFPEIPTGFVLLKLQEAVDNIEEFGYLKKVRYWDITGVNDCDRIYTDHVNFMNNIGNEFLNRYSTLEGIHNNLNIKFINEFDPNGDMAHYQKGKSFFGDREMLSGLIAAYLVDYDDIDNLIHLYKKLHSHINMHKLIDRVRDYFENNIIVNQNVTVGEKNISIPIEEDDNKKKEIKIPEMAMNKKNEGIEENTDIEVEIKSTSDAVSEYLKGNEEKVIEWLKKDRRELGEFVILLEDTYRDDGKELYEEDIFELLEKMYPQKNS